MSAPVFERLAIVNPKRHADIAYFDSDLFPYYAGYSAAFTTQLLQSADLTEEALVLDPWNGAGTTVQAAHKLGLQSFGLDLNPAMVIVAKAGLLSSREVPSLVPLAESIIEHASEHAGLANDPLEKWLSAESAEWIRCLESEINKTLVSHENYRPLTLGNAVNNVSSLAAFFYVALFRSVRRLLASFIPTNPTWVKSPKTARERRRPSEATINEGFVSEVRQLADTVRASALLEEATATISLGTSERIPLSGGTADFILSSPPYCTRIDYAMATAIELAVLRAGIKEFDSLRRSLMGTSTVEAAGWASYADWGSTCTKFLGKLYAHRSKASQGYYYKSHLQYFDSLYRSIRDISRVLKPNALCVLVVQDSHYKEIHNDVPTIAVEMAANCGLGLCRCENFRVENSMVQINKRAKKYLKNREEKESVLCLVKH